MSETTKNRIASIAVILVIILITAAISDFMLDTQIYRSVFCGYRFAEDSRLPLDDPHKIVYHGSLKKLVRSKPEYLNNFMCNTAFNDEGTNGYFLLQCSDYTIEHYDRSIKYWKGDSTSASIYTHKPHVPANTIFSEPSEQVYNGVTIKIDVLDNVSYLVTDRKTGQVYAYTTADMREWLNTTFGFDA